MSAAMFGAVCVVLALGCGAGALVVLLCSRLPGLKGCRAPSFASLLDYCALSPEGDLLILKDGSLCAMYEVTPSDLDSLSQGEQNRLRTVCSHTLRKLEGGWSLNFDVVRYKSSRYLPDSYAHPSRGARAIEEERRRHFQEQGSFECRYVLSITKKGSLHSGELIVPHQLSEELLKSCERFNAELRALCDPLQLELVMRRLGVRRGAPLEEQELLSHVLSCLCGGCRHLAAPAFPVYLDAELAPGDFVTGTCPRLGDSYIACVAVEITRPDSMFCMLKALSEIEAEYRFSTRFISLSRASSGLALLKKGRFWEQRRRSLISQVLNTENAPEDNFARKQVADVELAKDSLSSGDESFGAYSGVVVLHAPEGQKLCELVAKAVKQIEELGFGARVETLNTVEAFLGSLPGQVRYNLRRPLISSRVLCDLLPLNEPWHGEKYSPNDKYSGGSHRACPLMQVRGSGGGVFYLNLHYADLGNTLIFGPPGAGKSVLLCALVHALLRYPDMKIIAFERGSSFYALCKAVGGQHIHLDHHSRFCPLGNLEGAQNLSRALEFIRLVCALDNFEPDSCCLEALKNNLSQFWQVELDNERQKLEKNGPVPSQEGVPPFRAVPGIADRSLTAFSLFSADKRVSNVLKAYLRSGGSSSILDGRAGESISLQNSLNVFELGRLFEDRKFLPPVLLHLFQLMEASLTDDGHPAAVILDEAWLMLKNPMFREAIKSWIKTMRKHNVVIIMATQSIADISDCDIGEELFDCAKTRIYLPNSDALQPRYYSRYENAGLNDAQIRAIAHARIRRDYFIHKARDFARFELELTPLERALYSLSGSDGVKQVNQLWNQYHEDFYRCLTAGPGALAQVPENQSPMAAAASAEQKALLPGPAPLQALLFGAACRPDQHQEPPRVPPGGTTPGVWR